MSKGTFKNGVDFRDDSTVYVSGVKRPSFMYDKDTGIMLRYGDYAYVYAIYLKHKKAYEDEGFTDVAEALSILEVPPDQNLVDDLFQSSGRFTNYVKHLEGEHVKGLH
jgi:hypothetical protein